MHEKYRLGCSHRFLLNLCSLVSVVDLGVFLLKSPVTASGSLDHFLREAALVRSITTCHED